MASADIKEKTEPHATGLSRADSSAPSASSDTALAEAQGLLEKGKACFASDTAASLLLSQKALALV